LPERAAWLNAKGARTARGRAFGKHTVREMLVNAASCGFVTGLRYKSRDIRGRHEPIVPKELYDRVQEVTRSFATSSSLRSSARPPRQIRTAPAAAS